MKSKAALDKIIQKSRVHFYKPIQIAEILYQNRTAGLDVSQLENYRSASKRWRDDVSLRLVGSRSTSSSKFQDDIYSTTAVPPDAVIELAEYNKKNNGIVEAYIYKAMLAKMNDLGVVHSYLVNTPTETFKLTELLDLFSKNPGLRRSMDKVYEIVTYALFETIIEGIGVSVTLGLDTKTVELQQEFEGFTEKVFRLRPGEQHTEAARIFRVGSTNANDGGLDLWANFGPAIQVKHFALHPEHLTSITTAVKADRYIVVCTDAEKDIISSILKQAGDYPKVQSIVTLSDLDRWCRIGVSEKYKDTIGREVVRRLLEEFEYEFPSNKALPLFLGERGYDTLVLPSDWDTQAVVWQVDDV